MNNQSLHSSICARVMELDKCLAKAICDLDKKLNTEEKHYREEELAKLSLAALIEIAILRMNNLGTLYLTVKKSLDSINEELKKYPKEYAKTEDGIIEKGIIISSITTKKGDSI